MHQAESLENQDSTILASEEAVAHDFELACYYNDPANGSCDDNNINFATNFDGGGDCGLFAAITVSVTNPGSGFVVTNPMDAQAHITLSGIGDRLARVLDFSS